MHNLQSRCGDSNWLWFYKQNNFRNDYYIRILLLRMMTLHRSQKLETHTRMIYERSRLTGLLTGLRLETLAL